MKNKMKMMMLGSVLGPLAAAGCGGSNSSNGNDPQSPPAGTMLTAPNLFRYIDAH